MAMQGFGHPERLSSHGSPPLPIRSHSLHAIYLHLREGGGESAKNGRRAAPRALLLVRYNASQLGNRPMLSSFS